MPLRRTAAIRLIVDIVSGLGAGRGGTTSDPGAR
jgi:hypothetical protein